MPSNINPSLEPTKSLVNFRFWCQKVLPLVYDDSLSYYEVLGKMVVQLNDVIDDVNADTENVLTLKDAFLELQTYVNNFFDDIDQLASYAERAEAAQTAANTSAINAASSASNASASSLAAMDARDTAVAAGEAAQASANTANTAASNANTKANEAAQSAITAQTAQASASQSATLAATDRSAAQTAASTATTKANEASESASSAEQNATNAADSAAEAVAAVDTVVNGLGNITKTIENTPIATTEDALPSLAKKLVVDIEPAQNGTGDPAPDNARPITGWTGAKVMRTGANVWDESWELGYLDPSTGQNASSSDCIRAKNYSPIVPNTPYYVKTPNVSGVNCKLFFYDDNKSFISWKPLTNEPYTVPSNARYFRFYISNQYGTTYNHDISINYPATDTTYHPYTGSLISVTFPSEAGTVYGGTIDVTNRKMVVDRTIHVVTESDVMVLNQPMNETVYRCGILVNDFKIPTSAEERLSLISSMGKASSTILGGSAAIGDCCLFDQNGTTVVLFGVPIAYNTAELARTYLSDSGCVFIAPIANPIEYTLSESQALTLLNGINNVWADTGNINTLEYFTNAENYVTVQVDIAKGLIAPILKDMIADTALVANDFRIVGNTLYRITGNVASGGTLTPNTNCVATTVGAILKSLLSV